MSPDWSQVTVVMPADDADPDTVRGAYGRVYIDGQEIKSVSRVEVSPIVGDDIPEIIITLNPRNLRILLDTDFTVDDEDMLIYDAPRKLRIRKGD